MVSKVILKSLKTLINYPDRSKYNLSISFKVMALKNLTKNKPKNMNKSDKNLLFREPSFMKVIVRQKSKLRPQSSLPLQNISYTKQNTFIPDTSYTVEEKFELVPQNTLIRDTTLVNNVEKYSEKESSFFNCKNSGGDGVIGNGSHVKGGLYDKHRIVRVCI